MKLPIPTLLTKKKSSSQHYLSLMLRDEKVAAIIIEELNGKIKIIGRHEESLATPLEEFAYEELLNVLDRTISRAEDTLPPNIETEKTVFGVKESWVEDKKIKKEYLSKLKKICDELSLSPIGFMVISEAISHLLQKEEGAPLSAILAEIGKGHVTLSLFRAGKMIENYTGPMEASISKTVDTLLHHFTVDVLPSRIILSGGEEDETLSQEFIAHHWSKSIPFLHVPQISVLPLGFDGKAMVYGAAEQMGLEAVNILDDLTITDLPVASDPEVKPLSKKHAAKDEEEITPDAKEEEPLSPETESKPTRVLADADAFGFVMDEDIATVKPTPVASLHEDTVKNDADFSINREENDNLRPPEFSRSEPSLQASARQGEQSGSGAGLSLGAFMSVITSIPSKLPFKGIAASLPQGKLLFILPVVGIALIALVLLYMFQMKAIVTLAVEPKGIEKEEQVNLALGASNDFAQRIIAAKEVEVEVEGSSTMKVTGKKEVGEKAKGTITIISSVTKEQTIPEGAAVISSNGLAFIMDKSVKLASSSGVSDIKSVQVPITARVIGKEFNLPSNTKFAVANFDKSSVEAKNDSAFAGGSKEEVRIFSKADADKLSEELPKSLEEKARVALKAKVASGEIALEEFTDITLTKKNFNKDINDETDQVTLTATVLFTTLSYQENDVKELAQSLLKGEFSQELSLTDKGTEVNLTDIEITNDDEIEATLSMKAGLLPKFENAKIADAISGKSFDDADAYLKTLSQVASAEIALSPNIPFLPKFLPRMSKNIELIYKTQ